jgi:hypothetical protein
MPSLSPAQSIRVRARRSLQLLGVALLPAALACAPAQASSTPPVAAASQSEAARSTQRMIDRDLWRPFIEHFAAGQTEA